MPQSQRSPANQNKLFETDRSSERVTLLLPRPTMPAMNASIATAAPPLREAQPLIASCASRADASVRRIPRSLATSCARSAARMKEPIPSPGRLTNNSARRTVSYRAVRMGFQHRMPGRTFSPGTARHTARMDQDAALPVRTGRSPGHRASPGYARTLSNKFGCPLHRFYPRKGTYGLPGGDEPGHGVKGRLSSGGAGSAARPENSASSCAAPACARPRNRAAAAAPSR